MKRLALLLDKSLDVILASFLFFMGAFVFGNVVLRYFFNSGITWAEEMSRFLFVWLTFIGAVAALKENKHLGFSSLIQRMPLGVKKALYICGNCLNVYILYLLLGGSWEMTVINVGSKAPATGLPLAFMFGIGLVSFAPMLVIILINSYRALFVEGAINELVDLKDSEDEITLDRLSKGAN